ncbi:MAG TPA: alpha/beta fold hydrolase, partial [Blastocatellia bacterium]|nr:alpha/beta fold hydrolase [Blastocatellia bacterium]
PMVSIKDGPSGTVPLLCVPGAGATAISFLDLAGGLEQLGPIEGLQPRGLDGALVPHSTVPAAARAYLRCIEQKYPTGPVHLLGHSFGGWVVFELAQMLRAAGRPVASLTILDSEAPGSNGLLGREYSRTEAMMELVDLYEQAAQCSLEIAPNQMDALGPLDQLELLSERLRRAGLLPRRSRSSDLIGMVRTFEVALRIGYRPAESYPDPVGLALAPDPKKDQQANELEFESRIAGWRRWAPNLTVWRSPGNHMTQLRQPHVTALTGWLLSML